MCVVLLQIGSAGVIASACLGFSGWAAAGAALAGGSIAAIGSGLLGWRMFLPGVAAARVLRRAMVAGEALKWTWTVFALWVALGRWRLAPLPLLLGLIVAQFGYWLGLVGMKRG